MSKEALPTPENLALASRFASGRVTVKEHCSPPAEGCAPRYSPKVAGKFVRPTGMPEHGYGNPVEARAAGIAFREECRDWLAKHEKVANA